MKLSTGEIVHHMDDANCFEDAVTYPRVLHPLWTEAVVDPEAVVDLLDWYRIKPPLNEWNCLEGHSYDNCLCHTGGLIHWGQDESVYGCKSLPSFGWIIAGKNVLCPKSDGQGWLLFSLFACIS